MHRTIGQHNFIIIADCACVTWAGPSAHLYICTWPLSEVPRQVSLAGALGKRAQQHVLRHMQGSGTKGKRTAALKGDTEGAQGRGITSIQDDSTC